MVYDIDDEMFAGIVIVIWMLAMITVGALINGYAGALIGCLFGLICMPAILFVMGASMFKRHEDIYG